jgi:hypothetical protein
MNPPKDKVITKGEIADYYFKDGILVSLSKGVKRRIENIGNKVELVKKLAKNTLLPLMVYLTNSPIPNKEARAHSKEQLPVIYSTMVMVSKPGLSQFIMSLLFKFQKPPIL